MNRGENQRLKGECSFLVVCSECNLISVALKNVQFRQVDSRMVILTYQLR